MVISRDASRTIRRRARGAARRLRDAGTLLATGTVPARRTRGGQEGAGVPTAWDPSDGEPVYFGWTRYSAYFTDNRGLGFRASARFPDEDSYLRHLWSAERMAVRAQIFLDLSVPVLQAMSERHDYRHVVTYSPEMPDPWLSQLHEAAQRYDVLDLHPVADGAVTDVMRARLERHETVSRPAVWFRLDDDDLLSTDYLDIVDRHVRTHGPMWAISLSKGVQAIWHEGRVEDLRGKHRPLGSQGQACIGRWDARQRVLTVPELGSHTTVDTRVPTVLDSRRATYVQLIHTGQDTRTTRQPTVEELRTGHRRNRAVVTRPDRLLPRFPTLAEVYQEQV